MHNFIFALVKVISVLANLFGIIASGIAIYIFFFKIDSLKAVFRILINYTYQITLNELTRKMDEINTFTTDDPDQKKEIINILNDIEGQLKGNKLLKEKCKETLLLIFDFTSDTIKLTEPKKRSLISELRENLRTLNIENYSKLLGSKQ